MVIKIVTLFLIGMGVLAMFGRLRLPKIKPPGAKKSLKAKKCPKCGAYILGKGPCACSKKS